VYYAPGELESALREAGFDRCEIRRTERYFLMGTALR